MDRRTGIYWYGGVAIIALLIALVGVVKPPSADGDTPEGPPAGTPCGTQAHFFASEVDGHKFGPAAPEAPAEAAAELERRLCVDPALAVTLSEYVQCNFTTPELRVRKVVDAIQDPAKWAMHFNAVMSELKTGNPRVETMSGSYQTLYMTLEGRIVPEVFATKVDRPTFKVLRFDTPCGVKNLKLDCGFQPVEQEFFPGIPKEKPGQPSSSQPPQMIQPPPTPGGEAPPQFKNCAAKPGLCGTPDSGPEFIPVQDNNPAHVQPTQGYTPGRAEEVITSQTIGTPDSYTPTPDGSVGTGGGGVTPVGATDGPSGTETGGSAGASAPEETNASGDTSTGTVEAPS